MNVQTVKEEILTALAGTGLRGYAWDIGSISPPAALPGWPDDVEYVGTYGRGQTRVPDLPLLVIVGKASERSAATALGAYLAETGATSVPAKIEGRAGSWVACDVVTVTRAKILVVTFGGVEYLAAEFHLDIVGKGV